MIERNSDPIFAAIEKHRLADAAWDDSLDRCADEPVKDERHEHERAALVALLRTRLETLAGALAVLRYMADYASNNNTGLFHGWSNPLGSAGAAFLPMIADAIEAATR
jgi:hypothetical protein